LFNFFSTAYILLLRTCFQQNIHIHKSKKGYLPHLHLALVFWVRERGQMSKLQQVWRSFSGWALDLNDQGLDFGRRILCF